MENNVNPILRFQIDYPVMQNMYILEHETLPSSSIQGDFSVIIDAIEVNDTIEEVKKFALSTINESRHELGATLFQDLRDVNYSDISGFEAMTYYKIPNNNTVITKYVFLPTNGTIYQVLFEDFNEDYHIKEFDKMVNSIKFFDQFFLKT
jgi:hypothetical protein